MTEIPEHLLNRSKAARQAATGGGADSGAPAAPAAATPATVAASAPAVAKAAAPAKAAPAAPPPPKPDPAYVVAAKTRKKIPFWAMATLSLLPIWAFMYMQGLKPQAPKLSGPLAEGAHQYKSCQTCHGGKGEGGSGRQLSEGEVLKTFPRIEDQLNWVYNGTSAFQLAKIPTYGDPARPGGARVPGSFGAAMPQQGAKAGGGLSEAEILAVVCDERYPIGGADRTTEPYQAEFELWCSPESEIWVALEQGAATFDNLSEKFKAKGVIPVGTAPRLGSSAKK